MNEEIISMTIIVTIAIIAQLYLGNREERTFVQFIIEIVFWTILGYLFLSSATRYLFNIDITAKLRKLIEDGIKSDEKKKKKKKVSFSKEEEVFHVSGNKYRYKDAAPICKAHGARLATYDDMERAYERGAEWCEYGWSEDQMAFFPTQKETYDKLQDTPNKNACGRPGINGGYIENPNVRFGVNCYGVKPDINDTEKYLMDNTTFYENPEDKKIQKRANYWESRIDELILSPFNQNKWSRI